MAEAFMNAEDVPPLIGDVDPLLDRLQRFHGRDERRANDDAKVDDRRWPPTGATLFALMRAADIDNARGAEAQ